MDKSLLNKYIKINNNYYVKINNLKNIGVTILFNDKLVYCNDYFNKIIKVHSYEDLFKIIKYKDFNELSEAYYNNDKSGIYLKLTQKNKTYTLSLIPVSVVHKSKQYDIIFIYNLRDKNYKFMHQKSIFKYYDDKINKIFNIIELDKILLFDNIDNTIHDILHYIIDNFEYDSVFIVKYFDDKFLSVAYLANKQGVDWSDHYQNLLVTDYQDFINKVNNSEMIILDDYEDIFTLRPKNIGVNKTIYTKLMDEDKIYGFMGIDLLPNIEFYDLYTLSIPKIFSKLISNIFIKYRKKINVLKKFSFYNLIMDSLSIAICIHIKDKIYYINQAGIDLFNLKQVENNYFIDLFNILNIEKSVYDINLFDLVHTNYKTLLIDFINKSPENESLFCKFETVNGSVIDAQVKSIEFNYFDKNLNILLIENISSIKKISKDLIEAELKYKTLVNISPDSIIVISKIDNKIKYMNKAAVEYFNVDLPLIMGKNISILFEDKTWKIILEQFPGPDIKNLNGFRLKNIIINDKKVSIEINTRSTYFNGEPSIVILIRDITSEIEREKRIKREEKKFSNVFYNSSDAMFISDYDGNITVFNKAFRDLFKIPNDVDLSVKFDSKIGIDEDNNFIEYIKINRECKNFDIQLNTYDNKKLYCKITAWINDQEDTPQIEGMIRDVTDDVITRKREVQVTKFENLGMIARALAHDFNNSLMTIIGTADIISKMHKDDKNLQSMINIINKTIDKTSKNIKQLLAYSGKAVYTISKINLNSLIKSNYTDINFLQLKNVIIKLKLSRAKLLIKSDEKAIIQIINNLIINSDEALDKEDIVEISTGLIEINNEILLDKTFVIGLQFGKYAYLTVKDNGVGIKSENLIRIFDPFFTDKGEGRGLGLAVVIGIIKSMKGSVSISSELNKGTEITVYFPLA